MIAAVLIAAFVPDAGAVFPGANGKIVVATALTHPVSGDDDVGGHAVWLAARGRPAVRLFRGAKPSFSPRGNRLVYQEPFGYSIEVSRADGSHRRVLAEERSGTRLQSPAWSPLGDGLAFFRDGEGLFVMRASGGNERLVLPSRAYEGEAAWSPAGTELALAGSRGLIHAVGLDGSLPRRIARGWFPSWVTDRQLVFQRRRSLYLAATTGAGGEDLLVDRLQVLDPFLVRSHAPEYSLSPRRKRIAFARRGRIHVVRISGGAAPAITPPGRTGACCPLFSPDGRLVAFVRGHAIFVIPARGGTERLFARLPRAPGCSGLSVPRECYWWVAGLDWQARPRTRD